MTPVSEVRDNTAKQRFEIEIDGATAFVEYNSSDGVLTFTHTEVPELLGGRGVGSQLARGALKVARERGRKVAATCPFVAAFLKKHAEYNDILARGS